MENNKISIIVPIYNSEKYLKRCIDSLIGQTYTNLEFLLVDDGSADHSGIICDEYQNRDSRIHVIHTKNRGVSAARNTALEHVSGEYVMFVDSDDWIENDMCEELLSCAVMNNAMLVTSSAIDSVDVYDKDPVMRTVDIQTEFSFLDSYAPGVVWGTLYRWDCIKNLRFEEDIFLGEDTLYFAAAVRNCPYIIYTSGQYYHYMIYSSSAAHGRMDDKKMTNLYAWERVCDLFADNHRIFDTAKGAYGRQCAYFIHRMVAAKDVKEPYYGICKSGMRENLRYMMHDSSIKNKIYYLFILLCPRIYIILKK